MAARVQSEMNMPGRTYCRKAARTVVCLIALGSLLFAGNGCVYFNTFYNARKSFKAAEKSRRATKDTNAKGNQGEYNKAIEKASKVVDNHPRSAWYDDALYVLGVSYYHTDKFSQSERRMREILANYPHSRYRDEAEIYLAKAKLKQKEYDDALPLFETIMQTARSRAYRAEAARTLGAYYFENDQIDEAQRYMLALRDSLGTAVDRLYAQRFIADASFERARYAEALSEYLQILGMKPDLNGRYHALWRAALCAFQLQRLKDGQAYLTTLAKDPFYFDSLGVIKLKMASGYLLDEDIPTAELIFDDVIRTQKNNKVIGEAFFQEGLLAQFEYDDLPRAKKLYDTAAASLGRGTPLGQEAVQRAGDIAKLDTYRTKIALDSTATQDKIDNAAQTQLQLADLYWSKFNKPESALTEVRFVIDSFPESKHAPRAMITLAEMTRDYTGDTLVFDSILEEMLKLHGATDEAEQALALLGRAGTNADTGYASSYIRRAEAFLQEPRNVDSAIALYRIVGERFPGSRYRELALFAPIYVRETYASPGDSSIIAAYQDFLDSFPQSSYASEAYKRVRPPEVKKPAAKTIDSSADSAADSVPEASGDTTADSTRAQNDSTILGDRLERVYTGPDGERLPLLLVEPYETLDTFVFPQEALGGRVSEYLLYFQIRLDFSGKVKEYTLVGPSGVEPIDREMTEAVASMRFDMQNIPLEQRNGWLVYRVRVIRPDFTR